MEQFFYEPGHFRKLDFSVKKMAHAVYFCTVVADDDSCYDVYVNPKYLANYLSSKSKVVFKGQNTTDSDI